MACCAQRLASTPCSSASRRCHTHTLFLRPRLQAVVQLRGQADAPASRPCHARHIHTRAQPDEKDRGKSKSDREDSQGSPVGGLLSRWAGLTLQQKLYTVLAGLVLLLLLTRMALFSAMFAERIIVRAAMGIEQLAVATLISSAGLAAVILAVGLVGLGIYVFLTPPKKQ